MARLLNETERNIIRVALSAYAEKLDDALSTGIDEVDKMVAFQANTARELDEIISDARRMSVTEPKDE